MSTTDETTRPTNGAARRRLDNLEQEVYGIPGVPHTGFKPLFLSVQQDLRHLLRMQYVLAVGLLGQGALLWYAASEILRRVDALRAGLRAAGILR